MNILKQNIKSNGPQQLIMCARQKQLQFTPFWNMILTVIVFFLISKAM